MKNFFKIVLLSFLVFIGSCVYVHYYNISGNNEHASFDIDVDDELSFKFRENPTIDAAHKWVNKSKCKHVVLVDRNYTGNFFAFCGFKGAGGTLKMTFKGISPGVDTIKIGCCEAPELDEDTLNREGTNRFVVSVEE